MFKHRLVTGISVAVFFVCVILYSPWWLLLALMVGVFALALTEYRELLDSCGFRMELGGVLVCGLAYLAMATGETPFVAGRLKYGIDGLPHPALSEIVLWLAPAVFFIEGIVRRKTARAFECFAFSMAGFWYIPVLIGFMMQIAFSWPDAGLSAPVAAATRSAAWACPKTGRLVLLYFLLLVKLSDVGAYTFGTTLGRGGRRLIPEISPAKSVAGLGGAYVGTLVASLAVWACAAVWGGGKMGAMRLSLAQSVLIALLLATTGVVGDLAESLLKRSLGVKDSSKRFPGLGGFLDMLDSLLFSAPFFYIYMKWFLI